MYRDIVVNVIGTDRKSSMDDDVRVITIKIGSEGHDRISTGITEESVETEKEVRMT